MKNFDRSLPMMLYRTLDAVMPAFRQVFADYGLTEQQWRVLRVLWEHESVSMADLAAHTLIWSPSLVGIVDRMSQATAAGAALKDEVSARVDAIYRRLEKGVDAKLWRSMYLAMDQIIAAQEAVSVEKTVA
jgi:hypothetical protein